MNVFLAAIRAAPSPAPGTETAEIRDIAPPVDVPLPLWQTALWIALALALLALAAWLIWLCWPRTLPDPPPTPRQLALAELARLRVRLHEMNPHEFSFEVSAVLRRYIEVQYGLRALEQTSDEFLAEAARASRFSIMDRRMLGEFLERADLIKFARQGAEISASEALLASATDFVNGGRM